MTNDSETYPRRFVSRRTFIAATATAGAGALLVKGGVAPSAASAQTTTADGVRHLIWVWQFSADAAPNVIGADLRNNNLGIVLKTHDGVEWMSTYDKSPFAVSGPRQVETLVRYYEDAGVPFHAWAVVKGIDPVREARMTADVLAAGARSFFLDIEPHAGFWQGTPADAGAFGQELRRLQPNGSIVTSVDSRPWVIARVPVAEFAAFSDMLAPQQYWRTFNTQANYDRFAESGIMVPPGGITPEFLNDVSNSVLAPYAKALTPVGQGATNDLGEWQRFMDHSFALGARVVSAWRYGVLGAGILSLLRDRPPPAPAVPEGPSYETYVVQPGDTLSKIAAMYGTTVEAIVEANGLSNPNLIAVGQELVIPLAGGGSGSAPRASAPPSPAPVTPATYTVQPGDTLSGIAARHATTVNHLVSLNSISNPNYLAVGQVLRLA